ncbi:MAG: helix-turn-helix domain-containing protein [Candidatus Moraniibacteriota bacterium]
MKTTKNTKTTLLLKAGLTITQAETFAYLLEFGEQKASVVAKNIQRPRGVAYKALDELLELELVEKIEKGGKIATFRPIHPAKLEKFFENKEKQAKKDKEQFFSSLPDLVSLYNLSTQKPGVTYFEGDEGIIKILEDGLTSNTDICMYIDVDAAMKYATEINERYGEKRKKAGIKKRTIAPDTPFARKYLENYNTEVTEVRFIPKKFFPFTTASSLEIYDGKLSYVTIDEKTKIGVLLHDRNIFLLHKQLFEFTWSQAKTFEQLT